MKNDKSDGFHKTEVGWIPKDWDCIELGRACINGGKYGAAAPSIDYSPELPRYIRITDITDGGRLSSIDIKSIRNEDAKDYLLEEGDFLFARTGATVGKTYLHNKTGNFAFAGYLIRFVPNPEQLLGSYLSNFTQSEKYWAWVRSTIHTGAQPNINAQEYSRLYIPLPSIDEQWAIIQVLSTWDRAIERVQRLIEAKRRQKKGLMQGLLTGRLRFPEFGESVNTSDAFPTDWEVKKLKQIFSQIDRPLGNHIPESVLSISAKVGFVDQKIKFGKVVAGKSLEKYILLQRGEFAYNRGNSNAYPQGCIYMLTEYDEGAIPNVYYAFRMNSGNMFPQFYQYYFESGLLNPQLQMFISSSARGDGLFNISSKDFFGIRIVVPPFEEQKKIAGVLGAMDEQIGLLKKQLERLKEQKKGLMQKLLTGEIRVKVE